MSVGEQIKKCRNEIKLSQKELGKKLGVSQAMIAQYESGKRLPKLETIQKIAEALEVPLYDLFVTKTDNLGISIDLIDVKHPEDITKYLSAIDPHFNEEFLKEKIEAERIGHLSNLEQLETQNIEQLVDNYLKLNDLGQQEAVKRVEELTEIPRYTKKEE